MWLFEGDAALIFLRMTGLLIAVAALVLMATTFFANG